MLNTVLFLPERCLSLGLYQGVLTRKVKREKPGDLHSWSGK